MQVFGFATCLRICIFTFEEFRVSHRFAMSGKTLVAWSSSFGQNVSALLSSLIRLELLEMCDESRILCVQIFGSVRRTKTNLIRLLIQILRAKASGFDS